MTTPSLGPATALKRVMAAYDAAPTGFDPEHWTRFQPNPYRLRQWNNSLANRPTSQLDIVALQLVSELQAEYANDLEPWIEDKEEFLARVTALDTVMQARGYRPSAGLAPGSGLRRAPPLPEVTSADASGRPAIAAMLAGLSDDTLRGFGDYIVHRWGEWRRELRTFDVLAASPYGPIVDAISKERARRHAAGSALAAEDFPEQAGHSTPAGQVQPLHAASARRTSD